MQPANAVSCTGESAAFQVEVRFSGKNPSFQWQFDDGNGFVDLNDADRAGRVVIVDDLSDPSQAESVLTINDLDPSVDTGAYRCIATDDLDVTISETSTLEVNEPVG
ncbi:MAG: hypothetical protein IID39_05545, partial [Planctomycetes bacterium]|nr:hypothetical protein [Planctomycetota bacterium]